VKEERDQTATGAVLRSCANCAARVRSAAQRRQHRLRLTRLGGERKAQPTPQQRLAAESSVGEGALARAVQFSTHPPCRLFSPAPAEGGTHSK
jgi:hypothetical protein